MPRVLHPLRRPAPTIVGAILLVLRAGAAFLLAGVIALGWQGVLTDPGVELDPDSDPTAVGVVVGILVVFGLLELFLAWRVFAGRNWARLLAMALSLIAVTSQAVTSAVGGPSVSWETNLLGLSIDVLIMLALSSERSREYAYARRRRRREPGGDNEPMGIVYSDIAVSADGFAAGPNQSEEKPLGEIDENWLHGWMFNAYEENRAEVDAIVHSGATIMGRNMFGPVRGEWDRDWRGWWGDEPPYHGPVFVLTHFPHDPIEMEGGTTFYFVTDGIMSALEQARAAAATGTSRSRAAPRRSTSTSPPGCSTSSGCT